MFDLKTFVTVLIALVVWRILDKNVLVNTPLASFEAESYEKPEDNF